MSTSRFDDEYLRQYDIAVVIPAYNEAPQIAATLEGLPGYVRHVIVVDDGSSDGTPDLVARVAQQDSRILLLQHERNQGVGRATVSGFRKALELEAQVITKLDGDGQMSPHDLPDLLRPLIAGQADCTKGNRFHDLRALRQMPAIRRAGNIALTFLAKAATGYWNCCDPCNGFLAIRAEVLRQIPLEQLDRSYYFEISFLSQLYLLGAVVRDVPLPAHYGEETSHLSVAKVLVEFPPRMVRCLLRRVVLRHFIYDFSLVSLYSLSAVVLLMFGAIYGGLNWIAYARQGVGAPTGTVVISAMCIMLGCQFLLSAAGSDVQSVPDEPLCGRSLPQASTKLVPFDSERADAA